MSLALVEYNHLLKLELILIDRQIQNFAYIFLKDLIKFFLSCIINIKLYKVEYNTHQQLYIIEDFIY